MKNALCSFQKQENRETFDFILFSGPSKASSPNAVVFPSSFDEDYESSEFEAEGSPYHVVDHRTQQKLENAFRRLTWAKACKSLLKRFLTRKVFLRLQKRASVEGGTLFDLIQSGVETLDDAVVGVLLPDKDSYRVFWPLIKPIISTFHGTEGTEVKHPGIDWPSKEDLPADLNLIALEAEEEEEEKVPEEGASDNEFDDDDDDDDVQTEGKSKKKKEKGPRTMKVDYVKFVQFEAFRSLSDYPLAPKMTFDHYRKMESEMKTSFANMKEDFSGVYHPIGQLPHRVRDLLQESDGMFDNLDRELKAGKVFEHWDNGRGVFLSHDRKLVIWLNQSDHLRIRVRRLDGKLADAYKDFADALDYLEQEAMGRTFVFDTKLGFITLSPETVGTGLKIVIRVDLGKNFDVKKINPLRVELKAVEDERGVYDISNKRTFGLSESQLMVEFLDEFNVIVSHRST